MFDGSMAVLGCCKSPCSEESNMSGPAMTTASIGTGDGEHAVLANIGIAIEDDSDWEDVSTESGESSVDDGVLFQALGSCPTSLSKTSLLTPLSQETTHHSMQRTGSSFADSSPEDETYRAESKPILIPTEHSRVSLAHLNDYPDSGEQTAYFGLWDYHVRGW